MAQRINRLQPVGAQENEDIRMEAQVRSIREKIEESRLKWFGHVV
jgi:hypothetical protein